MFFKIYLTLHINVQSSQIWSAWEWCRWIGKSTPAIGFYFFYFSLLNIFGIQSSEQLHKIQPPACSVHSLHVLKPILTGALWWKDSAKVLLCLEFATWWNFLLTRSCNPKSNLCLSRIFEVRFRGEKKMRAHANRDPNMQEVGFYEAAQNFVYLWPTKNPYYETPTMVITVSLCSLPRILTMKSLPWSLLGHNCLPL